MLSRQGILTCIQGCAAHMCSYVCVQYDCSSAQPGILMLGSSIWINGTFPARGPYCAGWNLTEHDLSAIKVCMHCTKGNPAKPKTRRCNFLGLAVFPSVSQKCEGITMLCTTQRHVVKGACHVQCLDGVQRSRSRRIVRSRGHRRQAIIHRDATTCTVRYSGRLQSCITRRCSQPL